MNGIVLVNYSQKYVISTKYQFRNINELLLYLIILVYNILQLLIFKFLLNQIN